MTHPMLQLELDFPAGRFFAAAHGNPTLPEWPPSPSRIFSALTASAYRQAGCGMGDEVREALQMFETLPPPVIFCPDAHSMLSPDRFVPTNDVKTFVDKTKAAHPLRSLHVARNFPSVFLAGSALRYVWPEGVSELELAQLDRLAEGMTHVGTSHSFVTARFTHTQEADNPNWVPNEDAEIFLNVARGGRLDELDQVFSRVRPVLRRPLPRYEQPQGYAAGEASTPNDPTPARRWLAWSMRGASWGIDTPEPLTRSVRRALLSLLGDDAPAAAHGHDASVDHLAFLPLADVGHKRATGRVLGVAIAIPAMPAHDDRLVMDALASLTTVILPDHQVARLERVPLSVPRLAQALKQDTWCAGSGGATVWSTVTPVILDRRPHRKTAEAVADAVALSLENAGYPRPAEITVLPSSDFTGAPLACEVPSKHMRCHARVRFAQPVCGPVIAGRGRHFGIGLFRPIRLEMN